MNFKEVPPICPGTEDHFEYHVFDHEEGPVLIYWLNPQKPRIWSHDSDYPWRVINPMSQWVRKHIARFQIFAWDDLGDSQTDLDKADKFYANSLLWMRWEEHTETWKE